jgi:hypothetical protein
MSDLNQWQFDNDEYLAAAMEWLRVILTSYIETQLVEPPAKRIAQSDVEMAAEKLTAAEGIEPPPALLILGEVFRLSRFEQNILLLCAAMELDTQIATLCARAQDDPQKPYPTFALALSLFEDPTWDVLTPERPLRFWRLIEINQPNSRLLTTSALRADERIVNYLKGLNYLDDRLRPFMARLDEADVDVGLPPSQKTQVNLIVRRLQATPRGQHFPIVQLLGNDTNSKQLIAQHVAAELELDIYRLPIELLPDHVADLGTLARLWQRESALLPLALYLDVHEAEEFPEKENPVTSLTNFLDRTDGLFFLETRDVLPGLGRTPLTVDIRKPSQVEQQLAWSAALDGATSEPTTLESDTSDSPSLLAAQFNLSLAAIQEVSTTVLANRHLDGQGKTTHDLLWQACLAYTRPRLDILAQRLEPIATWDDIVLRDDEEELLKQIVNQVSNRNQVYETWGYRQRLNRGLGIMALFAGESGTGKTMAAEVIANDLDLNLYRVDLSGVVSKYIGETEKNLRRLFDAAEDGGAVLFFDEADALFGKRSQVKDSHERYANIEINYLLQRMEAYQGLAILTSNRKSDLDEAFVRRIRFIVNFPFPDHELRVRIWQKIFPPETPIAKLDFDRLAQFKLAGGSIHNIALNATFLAADAGTKVTMPLMLNAVRTEHLKMDRLINEANFV